MDFEVGVGEGGVGLLDAGSAGKLITSAVGTLTRCASIVWWSMAVGAATRSARPGISTRGSMTENGFLKRTHVTGWGGGFVR